VGEVSAAASGEHALEKTMEKVAGAWDGLQLPVMNHRNSKHLWILGDVSELVTLLEDHAVTVQTVQGSRFVAGVKATVEEWSKKISLASDVLDEWLQEMLTSLLLSQQSPDSFPIGCARIVQRSWMYLENIFSAEDIQRQLPNEAAKF
ncbi:hypothetical protein FOZ63_020621, partial [Perkinsus olseni]